jgi:hypothetical protein
MPIAVTLAANGFWSPTVIAPIIVLTDEGQEFESQSQLWWDGSPGKNEERLRFVVEGHARLQQPGNIAEVTIHASMKGHYLKPGSEGGETMFEAHTTVSAKLGSYVILGASPSSTARGNAVALVMHITRD